jgi:ubiquinone/menaquinone biosynthesis C-methylase UbiE
MIKPRIIETNEGIQNELTAQVFKKKKKTMRDKGWNGIDSMLQSGIVSGNILEIGPGPGFVGLELLMKLPGATLTGCEISPAMIEIAEGNAASYKADVKYVQGNAMNMPFEDMSFDAVISNGSLHELEKPKQVFDEIYRLLRQGGRYCITDMRRDVGRLKKGLVYYSTKQKEMRPGLISSLNASYTANEILDILHDSKLKNASVKNEFFGLCIFGEK